MNSAEFIELAGHLLRSQSTLALATSAEDGSPRIAPLFYYCAGDLRLYWFSSPSSDHSKNLVLTSAAAVAVYRDTDHWKTICGVQLRGAASVVQDGEQRRSIEKAYIERFQLGAQFQSEISKSNLYEFRPSWGRYIDNSKGFGYKVEHRFSDV